MRTESVSKSLTRSADATEEQRPGIVQRGHPTPNIGIVALILSLIGLLLRNDIMFAIVSRSKMLRDLLPGANEYSDARLLVTLVSVGLLIFGALPVTRYFYSLRAGS